ncbi:MAG: arginine--tRNA ligase [Acholeplasmataceae bacterium]|nr:arginine--tRNA ligase [Acholeplasmataceae bacterium]
MFLTIKNNIQNKIEAVYGIVTAVEASKYEGSDLAMPLFNLAKKTSRPIMELASEIKLLLKEEPFIKETFFERGFLNIVLDRKTFAVQVLDEIETTKDSYGSLPSNGKTVVIDYSSPNIAKSFSVGHLRSTVIGASLYKIYEKRGYKAIGVNHLGDWGTQFGKMIVAYDMWGNEEGLLERPIDYLQSLYVRFHEASKENPTLEDKAREVFKQLEDGDQRVTKMWEKFREQSLTEFKLMYELLGVSFDYYQGEAFYNDKMDRIVMILEDKKLLEEDDGAMIVRLDNFDMPPALIKRTDGATLYMTRDLAALLYRHESCHFDKMLYVVGNEQKLHFRQLKTVSDLMGYNFDITHVNFGLVLMDGKKMTTRGGKVVRLYDVIETAVELAKTAIEQKNPNLENKHEVAKAVGVSAVIFNDLKNDRNLDIDFGLENMVSFEGFTGPSLQYSSVRIYSLLKGTEKGIKKNLEVYEDDLAFKLVVILSQFSQTLDKAVTENGPQHISRYLLNLAQAFNQFYGAHRIIVEDPKTLSANIHLISAVRTVLNEGMRLLGMQVLNEM